MGAPQGGNGVAGMQVKLECLANIGIKSRMQTYSNNNSEKHEQTRQWKPHKKFKAKRKPCQTIRESYFLFLFLRLQENPKRDAIFTNVFETYLSIIVLTYQFYCNFYFNNKDKVNDIIGNINFHNKFVITIRFSQKYIYIYLIL